MSIPNVTLANTTLNYLLKNGLKLGEDVRFIHDVFIDKSNPALISIGNRVVFSSRTAVLAHDASLRDVLGAALLGKVEIADNCFIGFGAIILPNTQLGKGCIVAAGSIVKGQFPAGSIVAGNPARIISTRDEFKRKHSEKMKESLVFSFEEYLPEVFIQQDKTEAYLTFGKNKK